VKPAPSPASGVTRLTGSTLMASKLAKKSAYSTLTLPDVRRPTLSLRACVVNAKKDSSSWTDTVRSALTTASTVTKQKQANATSVKQIRGSTLIPISVRPKQAAQVRIQLLAKTNTGLRRPTNVAIAKANAKNVLEDQRSVPLV